MRFLDDPGEMTPEQRLTEIAAILAAGYVQTHCKPELTPTDSTPFTEKPLDMSGTPAPPWERREEVEA